MSTPTTPAPKSARVRPGHAALVARRAAVAEAARAFAAEHGYPPGAGDLAAALDAPAWRVANDLAALRRAGTLPPGPGSAPTRRPGARGARRRAEVHEANVAAASRSRRLNRRATRWTEADEASLQAWRAKCGATWWLLVGPDPIGGPR